MKGDYARFRRQANGKYSVVMAISGRIVCQDLSIIDAAAEVKLYNSDGTKGQPKPAAGTPQPAA